MAPQFRMERRNGAEKVVRMVLGKRMGGKGGVRQAMQRGEAGQRDQECDAVFFLRVSNHSHRGPGVPILFTTFNTDPVIYELTYHVCSIERGEDICHMFSQERPGTRTPQRPFVLLHRERQSGSLEVTRGLSLL